MHRLTSVNNKMKGPEDSSLLFHRYANGTKIVCNAVSHSTNTDIPYEKIRKQIRKWPIGDDLRVLFFD